MAERHRQRLRLERIGEAAEELFSAVVDADPSDRPPSKWYRPRNRLRTLLVGLEDQLPICVQIFNAGSAVQARVLIPDARMEIERTLLQLGNGA